MCSCFTKEWLYILEEDTTSIGPQVGHHTALPCHWDELPVLSFSFRVAHNTISLFVPQVCRAITAEYKDVVFQTPTTPAEWRRVADRFGERWNLHHCCGAIDGKHVAIKKPKNSGTLYYKYILLSKILSLKIITEDAKHNFTFIYYLFPYR